MSKPTPARFAGFDADEENFEGIDLAPLHPQDIEKPVRRFKTEIDIARALELRRSLRLGWAEIGRRLALEKGRRVAYRGESVRLAVNDKRQPKFAKEKRGRSR